MRTVTSEQMSQVPSQSGVYLFFHGEEVVYIGKSVNIRARLRSHRENAKTDLKERFILKKADRIGYIVTESEFGALLLEASLIRKHRPHYNIRWKDDKSTLYITISTKEEYPKIRLSRKKELSGDLLSFGPFHSTRAAEMLLREARKIVPFCTQRKTGGKQCFYSKIGLCNPCPNYIVTRTDGRKKIELKRLYKKNIRNFIALFSNRQAALLDGFYKNLKRLKRDRNYEEGLVIRDKIIRIETLLARRSWGSSYEGEPDRKDMDTNKVLGMLRGLLQKYFPEIQTISRVECYDVSNLQLKEATASMVVFQNGSIDRSEYRRFRIKKVGVRSDVEMLYEALERRLKNSWRRPELILIDGGKPQVRGLLRLAKGYPIVGIAKQPDRLIIGVAHLPTVWLPNTSPVLNLIRLIRDESHRFAKKYHLLLRTGKLL